MTREEAVEELVTVKGILTSKYINTGSTIEAINIAIDALVNQTQLTPKKPLKNTDRQYDRYYYETANLCPRCHHLIYPNINMYCNKCGQAISWEESND